MPMLQNFVFPGFAVQADEAMYVRCDARCHAARREQALHFRDGGTLYTDTFYNALSVGAWKRVASVPSLALELRGAGEFMVTLGLHRRATALRWLDEARISLRDGEPLRMPIDEWPMLDDGLLFFRLHALGPARLDGAAYATDAPPSRDVRLGIVITHFNRQSQVQPAICRIRDELLEREDLAGRLTLTVVDNSRNLVLEPHPAIDHIGNRNLGGTGGFTRGLLTLIDGGRHTHALFMDDDASCEAESIARCHAVLSYARDPMQAVAGALLRESSPWQLLEKGSRFQGQVMPLKSGLDMRHVGDLLEAERAGGRPDYGAWWCFAFPLAAVRAFPFPFFVRGDDILFGLQNRFEIATMNGIACMGEDFSHKHGPMTAYLDARYHLVLSLLSPTGSRPRGLSAARLFTKFITSYLYGSARAVTLALRHVALGPDYFRHHLDLQQARAEIASWPPDEKLVALPGDGNERRLTAGGREPRWRRVLRAVTLQGFLLPGFLLIDRTLAQEKAFHGRAAKVFRHRRVRYEHPAAETGFVARYDRARFFRELLAFGRAWLAFQRQAPALRRAYGQALDELTSERWWRSIYAQEALVSAQAKAQARRSARQSARRIDEARPDTAAAADLRAPSAGTPLAALTDADE